MATKKAAKKAPAKNTKPASKATPAKRPSTKGAPKVVKSVAKPKSNNAIDTLIAKINTELGGEVVRRANEAVTSHLLRRPTGITSLDINIGGGFPAGALSLVTGEDGVGKDYVINCVIRELQRNYGDEMKVAIFSTEFPYAKDYARNVCGVKVADTDEEIEEKNTGRAARGLPPLTEEEVARMQEQIGEILLIQGVNADQGLDVVLDILATGHFQMVAINSLGVFETSAKEAKESVEEHAAQSSEAQLLARWIPKLFMLLNRVTPEGHRNETTIIATNQVRANRDQPKTKPGMTTPTYLKIQPGSGSWALKHGKAIDLWMYKHDVKDNMIHDDTVKPPELLGRKIFWKLLKGKLGTHDGKHGSYDYYFADGADLVGDMLATGVAVEAIEKNGAYYRFTDNAGEVLLYAQGVEKACALLRENRELQLAVREAILAKAGLICRYT
jgi:RecA/RadA recombinase